MEEGPFPEEVKFTYQKGNFYRVIHVDGAMGGIGPTGRYIHMALWNERKSIPKEMVYQVTKEGGIEKEPKSVDDIEGIFREVETCLVLDIPTAKAIKAWLERHLLLHEEIRLQKEQPVTGSSEVPHE